MQSKEEVKFGGEAMSLSAELSCLQVGGAERETSLVSLEKQLICPICLEIFSKPVVILPCQHNLCRKCANELYQSERDPLGEQVLFTPHGAMWDCEADSGVKGHEHDHVSVGGVYMPSLFQARTTMMVNSGRFRCPSCRHEVVLDRHGVYGLQRNLLVENIIDVYKQEVSCCISSPAPLPPPPASLSAQLTCSDHEGEKVNIYCLSCQVPTCSLCKVFGAHQKCKVAPLTDVYQQRKDELCEGISALKTFNNKVQALINELEETCTIIEENSRTEKQNVCDKFENLFSILKERQKAMTQRISSEQEEKTGHVQALSCCYGNSIEANNKLVETVKSSMEEPDMAAFVQNSRELISKVIAASSTSSFETLKPGYENLSHYRFNFSKQKRALKSIAFVKVVEDVPEELEVNPGVEESREPAIQDRSEPKRSQETSIQNLGPAGDVIKEPIPVLTSPSVEPAQTASSLGQTLLYSRRVTESVEASGENKEQDNVRPGQVKVEENQEPERCVTPHAVKEGNECEYHDGMSTQQSEGGEAGKPTKDERDPVFYPDKNESRNKVSPALCEPEEDLPEVNEAEKMISSMQQSRDHPLKNEERTQDQDSQLLLAQRSSSDPNQPKPGPQIFFQPELPLSVLLHAKPYISHSTSSNIMGCKSDLSKSLSKAPKITEATFISETAVNKEEKEEDEDMHGLEGLAVEREYDLSFPESRGCNSFLTGESDLSHRGFVLNMEEVFFELNNADKKDKSEASLAFKKSSELKRNKFGNSEKDLEAMNEIEEGRIREEEGNDDGVPSLDVEDDGLEITNTLDSEFKMEEFNVVETFKTTDCFNPRMETNVAGSEEKVTTSVSQAVTLLFYLLAFLLILQRVWAYIGCFICT